MDSEGTQALPILRWLHGLGNVLEAGLAVVPLGIGTIQHATTAVKPLVYRSVAESGIASTTGRMANPVYKQTFTPGRIDGGRIVATKGGTTSWGLSISETKMAISSAETSYKGSSVVGHALMKHSSRKATFSNPSVSGVDVWGSVTGKMDSWNAQGMNHMREILRAPGGFKPVNGFLEKRLPDGRGIRLENNFKFKGFID